MNSNKKYKRPLIIDWGIGGLGTVTHLPDDAGFVYVSDSGSTPYGRLETHLLQKRIKTIIDTCIDRFDCDLAVIACNAASAGIKGVNFPIDVIDIVSVAIDWLKTIPTQRLGIIGGEKTIESHVYSRNLADKECVEIAAQPLSAWVERGILEGEDVENDVRKVALSLGGISHLLLACTHYPALTHLFRKYMPNVMFLDPAIALAQRVSAISQRANERVYMTSGSVQPMTTSAKLAFNMDIKDVTRL